MLRIRVTCTNTAIKITRLLRPDYDIIHLKTLEFAGAAHVYTKSGVTRHIGGWDGSLRHDYRGSMDNWSSRPTCFEDLECLALHRRTLFSVGCDYECVIRHFFPSLRVLVILISDETKAERRDE